MPVDVRSHPSLPILIAVYSGVLTSDEYRAMRAQRDDLLAQFEGPVVVLADMRALESFPDARQAERYAGIFASERLHAVVIVLGERPYRVLLPALLPNSERHYTARFFDDADAALAYAEEMSAKTEV